MDCSLIQCRIKYYNWMEVQCLNEAKTIGLILLESIMINDTDSVKYLIDFIDKYKIPNLLS